MPITANMEKVYDEVKWVFSLKVMEIFDFCPRWIRWTAHYCLSISSFAVLLNDPIWKLFSCTVYLAR